LRDTCRTTVYFSQYVTTTEFTIGSGIAMVKNRAKWLLVWLGAVVASLGVGLIPGDLAGESLCGVWG
jgi:hypothetical protein